MPHPIGPYRNKQAKKLTSRQKNKMIEIIVVKHHQKQNSPINIKMLNWTRNTASLCSLVIGNKLFLVYFAQRLNTQLSFLHDNWSLISQNRATYVTYIPLCPKPFYYVINISWLCLQHANVWRWQGNVEICKLLAHDKLIQCIIIHGILNEFNHF